MPIVIRRTRPAAAPGPSKTIHIKGSKDSSGSKGAYDPGPADLKSSLRQLDVLIAMDCTASMGGIIDETKKRLSSLATSLQDARPDIAVRFGFIGYRDHCDPAVLPYQASLGASLDVLGVLAKATAEGGGDLPEAALDALDHAAKATEWSQPAQKVIILAADCPFHDPCPCGLSSEEVLKSLRAQGIVVHGIGASDLPETRDQFTKTAATTGGNFVPLSEYSRLLEILLGLVVNETRVIDRDVELYDTVCLHPDWSVHHLADHLGWPMREVEASLDRLRMKTGAPLPGAPSR